jgi:hypothetical protein
MRTELKLSLSFFLEHAEDLRIIILRRKEKVRRGLKQTAVKGGRHSKSLHYKGNKKTN